MYQIGSWQMRWLGHDSYQLTDGTTTLYLDPYQVKSGRKADYILLTHEHYDHYDPASIVRLRQPNSVLIGPQSVTSQLDEMAITLLPGESYEAKGLQVEGVAAYNVDKPYHPQKNGNVGFIINLDGKRLYHAGDTDLIPEMAKLGTIDVALLPVSGTYVMTASDAVEAVKIIKPQVAIPMHYGSIIGSVEDAHQFQESASHYTSVILLENEL